MPANIGIVVIGRNEGQRLVQCLESIRQTAYPLVYVDSGSVDESVRVAASYGVNVVQLDPARLFSAARARNEGFTYLLDKIPSIRFVQFVDGDCTLARGWIEAAEGKFADDPRRSAVMGNLLERNPDASVYNRLCAMEWRRAPGDLTNYGGLGGISMMRAEVFRELGGFRPDVIAGEDSELGIRMGLSGFKITVLDIPMATHDADIRSFRSWWRRAVRAGHAIGQRSDLNGKSLLRDCVRERNSTLFWGIGLPAFILLAALPSHGISFFLLAAYLLLVVRVWRFRRGMMDSPQDASLYAGFIVFAKFANAVGLMTFYLNRFARRYEIIEYK